MKYKNKRLIFEGKKEKRSLWCSELGVGASISLTAIFLMPMLSCYMQAENEFFWHGSHLVIRYVYVFSVTWLLDLHVAPKQHSTVFWYSWTLCWLGQRFTAASHWYAAWRNQLIAAVHNQRIVSAAAASVHMTAAVAPVAPVVNLVRRSPAVSQAAAPAAAPPATANQIAVAATANQSIATTANRIAVGTVANQIAGATAAPQIAAAQTATDPAANVNQGAALTVDRAAAVSLAVVA
jgi:hypothetical protein